MMKDMAFTKEEREAYEKKMGESCTSANQDKYPYGLCLHLNEETLKKLGFTGELPKVGETFAIQAVAEVKSVGMSEHANGDSYKNMELQVTHMDADKTETTNSDRANKLYNAEG